MVCFTFSLYANNYNAILVKNRASFVTILCHSMQSAGSEETGSFFCTRKPVVSYNNYDNH